MVIVEAIVFVYRHQDHQLSSSIVQTIDIFVVLAHRVGVIIGLSRSLSRTPAGVTISKN